MAGLRRPVIGGIGVVLAGGVVALAPVAHAAGPVLHAAVVQTSVWNSGYGADVVIRNSGDAAATGWTVEFDLPAGTTVTRSWSSVRTSVGNRHRFTDAGWNRVIVPGGSVTFGFNAADLGLPVNCTVNGAPCGAVPPTPVPPTTTTPPATTPPATTPPATTPPATTPPATAPPATTPPSVPPSAGPVVEVSTAGQLSTALAGARPRQTIRLAAGIYSGAFLGRTPGTAQAPITVTGPPSAIITNPGASGTNPGCPVPADGFNPGYGFWLFGAPWWRLTGFTVADVPKGIMIDASPHVTIDGVHVRDIGDEGVHFRRSSADGVIQHSRIENTGLRQPQYGEGIYLGSANSNWSCYGNTNGVDASDRILVLNNRVGPNVAAEHVDVKEGTTGGVIRGNTWNGPGIAGQNSADSWLDVKGSNYLIEHNTGTFTAPGVFANGYETHNPTAGSGCGNMWRDNVSDLGGVGGWAVNVTSTSKCAGNLNVVHASNRVTGATRGLTNIAVTP